VIFLSGRALPGDVEAGRAVGSAYLGKPFTMTALTAAVDAALAVGDDALDRAVWARLGELGDLGDLEQRALFAGLLTLFVERAPVLLMELERGAAAGDAVLVEHAAHQLGGSAVNLGAGPLARWCTELETWAREGAAPPPRTALAALRRELAGTCRVFTALAASLAPTQP
jgi:HPt (histidine-containing phosphotransfer) domain-containing protein